MDAFARIDYCAQSVIIVGGIGLVPVSPDATEGFCRLAAAATAYPSNCIWSVSGCAEIGRV
ncbi:hypothetical protein ACFWD7_40730 [Streptomyces mirabilis]|uniref:hypothetical protein n=1 Tax=Streptomyces TaxID=1883 RepID=UPI0021BDF816|nr:hypothetical protein [Streptomyces mirabilis]MCT9113205.1 hypothetical protein [Streptomyces mirabilis]